MKNIEKEIAKVREQLHRLYKNDNDAPRLIAEMLKEFTYPRGPNASFSGGPMSLNLG